MRASILTSGTTLKRGLLAPLLRLEISIVMRIYNRIEDITVDLMVIMHRDTTKGPTVTVRSDLEWHEDTGCTMILISSGVEVESIEIWV